MTGVLHMFVLLSIVALCGCDRQASKTETAEKGGGGPSQEIRELSQSIQALDECLLLSGSAALRRGMDTAQRIAALPDGVREGVASRFIGRLEEIAASMSDFGDNPKPLYNFQSLLKSVDICISDSGDAERMMGLCALCLDRYKDAIELCRLRDDEKGMTLRRDFETDRRRLAATVQKVYLPLVSARYLSPERHEYWMKTMASRLEAGCAAPEASQGETSARR